MTVSRSEFIAKEILDVFLKKYQKIDNYRPKWLGGLELDRYYPDLKFAIEFQGTQHYKYVPGMHRDQEDFKKGLRFDVVKEQLSREHGVKIYYLNIFDLTQERVRNFIRQLVRENNLEGVDVYKEINASLLLDADRLSRTKRLRRDRDPLWMRAIRNILRGL